MPRHIFIFNARNIRMLLAEIGFDDIQLPATANSGDWAVSFQNFFRCKKREKRKYERGLYFPIIGLLFAPIAFLSSVFNLNGVMDFICCKKRVKSLS